MQQDLDTVATAHPIRIFGVNAIGEEGANSVIVQGRTIPWLQDVTSQNVWESWHVTWRDVVVLDAENHVVFVYNLTANDLADSTHYAELRNILILAAQ
jgi:hypothetical protein